MNQIGNVLIGGGLAMLTICMLAYFTPDASKKFDALKEKPGCSAKILHIDKKPEIIYECGNKLYFKYSRNIVEIEK
jgi:hypothetical protein